MIKHIGKVGIGFIVFILLLIIMGSSIVVLDRGYYGVVKEFGQIIRVEKEAGLKFKTPFIQTMNIIPKKIQLYDIQPSEITTLDKKRVILDLYILWQIEDPVKYMVNLKNMRAAETRLSDYAYSVTKNDFAKIEFDAIVGEGKNREAFYQSIRTDINETLGPLGIKVVDIRVKRSDLPSSNENAIFEKMISERSIKTQEYTSLAISESERITSEANSNYEIKLSEANRKAQELIGEGEKEAAKIYNEAYGKDPEFFELYNKLESYKKSLKGNNTIVIPSESTYFNKIFN